MRRGRRILIAVLIATVFGGIAWLGTRTREPAYQGKRLSNWLAAYIQCQRIQERGGRVTVQLGEAEAAIRQIGTNGIPILLRMVASRDSFMTSNLVVLLGKQSFVPIHLHSDIELHNQALAGFQALGCMAGPAVPALIELLQTDDFRFSAALCISAIGPCAKAAVPSLVPWLDEKNAAARYCAATALGNITTARQEAVPALLQHFDDPNQFVRTAIQLALARHHARAELVVPVLVKELEARQLSASKIEALGLCDTRL